MSSQIIEDLAESLGSSEKTRQTALRLLLDVGTGSQRLARATEYLLRDHHDRLSIEAARRSAGAAEAQAQHSERAAAAVEDQARFTKQTARWTLLLAVLTAGIVVAAFFTLGESRRQRVAASEALRNAEAAVALAQVAQARTDAQAEQLRAAAHVLVKIIYIELRSTLHFEDSPPELDEAFQQLLALAVPDPGERERFMAELRGITDRKAVAPDPEAPNGQR